MNKIIIQIFMPRADFKKLTVGWQEWFNLI